MAYFGASGTYSIGGQGPFHHVDILVKRTDADGTSYPVESSPGLANSNNGNYTAETKVPYFTGKRYFVRTRVYNDSSIVISNSNWIEEFPK